MEGSVIGCETALKIAKHSGNYHQKATQMRQRGLFCVLCQFNILLLRDIYKISHVLCSWRFLINRQNTSKIFCAAYVNVDTRPLAHSIVWGCAGQRWAHPLPDGPVTTQPHNVAHNVAVTTQPHPECPGSGPVNPIWEPEKNWDRGGEQNLKVEHKEGKLPLHMTQPHHTWALSRSTQIYRSPPNNDEKFECVFQSQSPAPVCENLELWKDKYLFPKLQLFNFNNSGWMHIMITYLAVKQAQARPRLAKAACQPITERWRDALSSTGNKHKLFPLINT